MLVKKSIQVLGKWSPGGYDTKQNRWAYKTKAYWLLLGSYLEGGAD